MREYVDRFWATRSEIGSDWELAQSYTPTWQTGDKISQRGRKRLGIGTLFGYPASLVRGQIG